MCKIVIWAWLPSSDTMQMNYVLKENGILWLDLARFIVDQWNIVTNTRSIYYSPDWYVIVNSMFQNHNVGAEGHNICKISDTQYTYLYYYNELALYLFLICIQWNPTVLQIFCILWEQLQKICYLNILTLYILYLFNKNRIYICQYFILHSKL